MRPDLIVNATPLGRAEQANLTPILETRIGEEAKLFFDLNYNPARSKFLRQAEAMGVPAENGLRMMVYQAKASIDLAVGSEIPFDWFYAALQFSELEQYEVYAGPPMLRPHNGDRRTGALAHAGDGEPSIALEGSTRSMADSKAPKS